MALSTATTAAAMGRDLHLWLNLPPSRFFLNLDIRASGLLQISDLHLLCLLLLLPLTHNSLPLFWGLLLDGCLGHSYFSSTRHLDLIYRYPRLTDDMIIRELPGVMFRGLIRTCCGCCVHLRLRHWRLVFLINNRLWGWYCC